MEKKICYDQLNLILSHCLKRAQMKALESESILNIKKCLKVIFAKNMLALVIPARGG